MRFTFIALTLVLPVTLATGGGAQPEKGTWAQWLSPSYWLGSTVPPPEGGVELQTQEHVHVRVDVAEDISDDSTPNSSAESSRPDSTPYDTTPDTSTRPSSSGSSTNPASLEEGSEARQDEPTTRWWHWFCNEKVTCCGWTVNCCSWEPQRWQLYAVIHPLISGIPTWYRLIAGEGEVKSSAKEERTHLDDDPNHLGHSAQGALTFLLLPEYDWEALFKWCGMGRWFCCNRRWGDETSKSCAAGFQLLQSAGLVVANLLYPIYNMEKRDEHSDDGYYGTMLRVFFDGSFYANHTDWVIGMGLGMAILFVLAGLFYAIKRGNKSCFSSSDPTGSKWSQAWIRKYIHRPIVFFLMTTLGIISIISMVWGEETRNNLAVPVP